MFSRITLISTPKLGR